MIRNARKEDALQLGNIYCLSWKEAYKGILSPCFLESLSPENSAPKPEHIYPNNNFVYAKDERIIGLINYQINKDENLGEIRSIYVLPQFWRSGIGQSLFLAAKEEMEKQNLLGFYLWVLKDNLRARSFYEKMKMTCAKVEKAACIADTEVVEIKYSYKFVK